MAQVVKPTCFTTAQLKTLTLAQKRAYVDNNKAAGKSC